MIEVEVNHRQTPRPFDERLIVDAVRHVLTARGVLLGSVSVAIVDDPEMQRLNRQHLAHDYPTDVLSFVYDQQVDRVEGELIVSIETAEREAAAYGWSTLDELLLYVIHGTLHLVGLDDHSDAEREVMRDQERRFLADLGRDPAISSAAARTSPVGDPPSDR